MSQLPQKSFFERRDAYIADIEKSAWPWRREGMELVKEGSAWGRLALQYAFILNGGALLLLPHLFGLQTSMKLAPDVVAMSMRWFAAGLVLAALCCTLAYANFMVHAGERWTHGSVGMRDALNLHFEDKDSGAVATALRRRLPRMSRWQWLSEIAGILLGLGAFGSFAAGALQVLTP